MDRDHWDRKAARFDRKMNRLAWKLERRRYFELRRHSPTGLLFSGFVFVAIGMLFLLSNIGALDVGPILRFWPVILIAAGVFKLAESREDYAHGSGVFWIVTGGLFLLGTLGFLRVSFRDLWPVVLIGFGSLLLWRSVLTRRQPRRLRPEESAKSAFADATDTDTKDRSAQATATSSDSIISAMAILGGVQRRNNSQDFRGGSVTAFMGGCEIDLRGAGIVSPNEPVLDVFALWGGIEIQVPPDWIVVGQVDPIMGGYEDSTQPPKEGAKRLVIRGTVIMGGIEISN